VWGQSIPLHAGLPKIMSHCVASCFKKREDLPFLWTRHLGKLAIPFLMCHCPSIDVWCLRQTTWYKLRRWMLAISDQMWCVNVIDLAQDAAGIISAVFKNTREGQKSNSITSPEKPSKQLHRIWFQTLDTAIWLLNVLRRRRWKGKLTWSPQQSRRPFIASDTYFPFCRSWDNNYCAQKGRVAESRSMSQWVRLWDGLVQTWNAGGSGGGHGDCSRTARGLHGWSLRVQCKILRQYTVTLQPQSWKALNNHRLGCISFVYMNKSSWIIMNSTSRDSMN